MTGRSKKAKTKVEFDYLPCDVSKPADVNQTLQIIEARYGKLNGIIFSAGIIRDNFIVNKTEDEIDAVAAVKIQGAWNLHQAVKDSQLDFMVFFSSMAGVVGNLGQADYSGTNAFLDAFASHHEYKSIAWPLWAAGGMRIDKAAEQWVYNQTGMRPLSTINGQKAFNRTLSQSISPFLVCQGELTKIRQSFGWYDGAVLSKIAAQSTTQVEQYLVDLCVELLKIKREDLSVEDDFSEYGVDSILMMNILNALEAKYNQSIPPFTIAEYTNIKTLASYLVNEGIAKVDITYPTSVLKNKALLTEIPAAKMMLKPKRRYRFSRHQNHHRKIAIIGAACRLAKSPNLECFWKNLAEGKDLISHDTDRWDTQAFYSEDKDAPSKSYAHHGGYLEDVAGFDASYFNLSDEEAITLDPQHRIVLELAQELFDRAGFKKEELSNSRTGVFIGAKDNGYCRNGYNLIPENALQHTIVNNISNMISARVSDFYNLKGASKIIDTACSSSLIAVHDACESIIHDGSEMAVAGGISLIVDPFAHVGFSKAKVLSEDGKSYVFDERAQGFVLGEGAGLVLLKDYEKAFQDGDQILGTILGSAVNNDGKTIGLTVPNQNAQKEVIEQTLSKAQVNPESITYLEAHGTGTLLGDPIEIKAATEAFRQHTEKIGYCAVGSVKSNVGHTMTAAGVVGLIKILLAMQHRQIPATLHCERPHPRFEFDQSPFYPNTTLKPWQPKEGVLRAALSSFGFGGTNCHMIIEEPPKDYRTIRQALNITQFKRKHYWLGHEIVTLTGTESAEPTEQIVSAEANTEGLLKGIEALLCRQLAQILSTSPQDIDPEENFMDVGADSTQMIALSKQIEELINIELYPTLFFEYPSVVNLAEYFYNHHREALQHFLGRNMLPSSHPVAAPQSSATLLTQKHQHHYKQQSKFDFAQKGQIVKNEAIAVIGMAGRFPQANSVDEFWQNLVEGKDCIIEIPKDRWDWQEVYGDPHTEANKTNIKWGGFIDGVGDFDPLFFGISPREAEVMDPQQRLLMIYVWKAIEDAGYSAQSLSGTKTAIFVGTASSSYISLIGNSRIPIEGYSSTGMVPSVGPNRMSYFLNVYGPSEPIETACSSSLVAIHRALITMETGGCDQAVVGGVNTIITPEAHVSFNKAGMLCEDGRCKTFSNQANGYVRGEGVGMLFLKKLSAAERERDHIYGLICGSAENHGGRANSLTAPNPNAQAELLKAAYLKAGVNPRSVSYIEAHGTGTDLGDPIEISGLKTAFKDLYKNSGNTQIAEAHCALGAVKSNIGHLELAAGIASVIKVLLQLKHRTLVKTLHCDKINPHIDIQGSPFYIIRKTTDWKRLQDPRGKDLPRLAGVSSFGFGGVNAHVVIKEYIEKSTEILRHKDKKGDTGQYLIVLSAKNKDRLKELANNLHDFINNQISNHKSEFFNLNDLAYTLQIGREEMAERLGFIVGSNHELVDKLKGVLAGQNDVQDIFQGHVKRYKEALAVFAADEDMASIIDVWIAKRKYEKLLNIWVKGLSIEWNKLYGDSKPRRISLPTYPFSRERYWVNGQVSQAPKAIAETVSPRGFKRSRSHAVADPAQRTQKSEVEKKLDPVVHEQIFKRDYAAKTPEVLSSSKALIQTPVKTFLLMPVWDLVPLDKATFFPSESNHMVIIGGTKEIIKAIQKHHPLASPLEIQPQDSVDIIIKKLKSKDPLDHILWIASRNPIKSSIQEVFIEEQSQEVILCFRMVKALLNLGYKKKHLSWSVITTQAQRILQKDVVNPAQASLHGLVGSMAKEYPGWNIRLIDLETDGDWPISSFLRLVSDAQGNAWGYRGQEWYKQKLIPLKYPKLKQSLYKTGGVYVVIGGAGGIGEIWSQSMIEKYRTQIIWIGRRKKDATIQSKLDTSAKLGPVPTYIQADATDRQSLEKAYQEIKQSHRQIHGVIHSAIVLLDQSLAKMDEDQLKSGLSAKIDVSVCIAQVFQNEPLDFVLFFSSMQSFFKAPGQSNYAAGCTFKDAFANQLALEWPCSVKVMNWGYWGSVGIVANSLYRDRMERAGVGSIEPAEGIEALESLLEGSIDQIGLVKMLRPQAMREMRFDDCMTIYSEIIPSGINDILHHLPVPTPEEVKRIILEDGHVSTVIDEFLCQLLFGILQSMDIFNNKTQKVEKLKIKENLLHFYERWLEESLTILSVKEYLQYDGESYTARHPPVNLARLWDKWNQSAASWMQRPDLKAVIVLAETCMRALPEILAGKLQATEILFPNSSMEWVEGIYKHNPIADYFNEVLAHTVVSYFQERVRRDSSTRIRILEIGAGTGGTSAKLFEKLQPFQNHIQEYCYSDISNAFLKHAEIKYGSLIPYLTYQLFNVEESIAGQGIVAEKFDLVIAGNVLHATKDIRQTLRNAKAPLRRNGLIILNEISDKSLLAHFTFGLLEGWWLYEDDALRIPGSPGLYPKAWKKVLVEEGFNPVFFPAEAAHELGQQIIVAQSDGLVRQKTKKTSATIQSSSKIQDGNIPLRTKEGIAMLLRSIVSEIAGIKDERLDENADWPEIGIDSILSMRLLTEIENQLGLRIYQNELVQHHTLKKLTEYVEQERVKKRKVVPDVAKPVKRPGANNQSRFALDVATPGKGVEKSQTIIYILSTPRAGSTLLRVMLGGHSRLFAPPELFLLPYDTLDERAKNLHANNTEFFKEGLIHAVRNLENLSVQEASSLVSGWENQPFTVAETYDWLLEKARSRHLVDKCPLYAMDQHFLKRTELFEFQPFYIHLIRHPLSVAGSFEKNRFHKMIDRNGQKDPWALADAIWLESNANIREFLGQIPEERWMVIPYEELVKNPKKVMKTFCLRIGLQFEERMLTPYEGDRMQGGLHTDVSLTIGDPNFLKHDRVETVLADAWTKQIGRASQLSVATRNLARKYGYSFKIIQSYKLAPAQKAFMNRFEADPVWHIVQHFTLKMDLGLNIGRLEESLQKVVDKHVVLRHRFVKHNGFWVQEETAKAEIKIWHKSLVGLKEREKPSQRIAQKKQLHEHLDLGKGRLLACAILEEDKGSYHLILVLHHLVADGVSVGRIFQDLMKYYHDSDKEEVKEEHGYRKYVEAIEELEQSHQIELSRSFWEEQLKNVPFDCPLDYNKGTNTVASEKEFRARYELKKLGLLSPRTKGQFFNYLALALYQYLQKWTGHRQPLVSHRLHRRMLGLNGSFQKVVGSFAGDIPLSFSPSTEDPILSQVREFQQVFKGIPRGGIGYELLVNQGTLPLVHTVCPIRLNYQRLDLFSLSVKSDTYLYQSPTHDRGYLLDLIVRLKSKEIEVVVRYSKNRHKLSTVKQLVRGCINKTKAFIGKTMGNYQPRKSS